MLGSGVTSSVSVYLVSPAWREQAPFRPNVVRFVRHTKGCFFYGGETAPPDPVLEAFYVSRIFV